ncbi:MAG: aryl-sulfate sulfotransferase [Candidatus Hodarchaeota archaeon]
MKSNKILVLCILTIVMICSQNHTGISEGEYVEFKFLRKPRDETIAVMDFLDTGDSLPEGLGLFTVVNDTTDLREGNSHLLVVNNQGEIVMEFYERNFSGYDDPQMFNETTLAVSNTRFGYLTFWDLDTNQQYTIEAVNYTLQGHHDWCYNPVTDTFMALFKESVKAEGVTWRVDIILEFDWAGNLLWEYHMSESDFANDYSGTQCVVTDHALEDQGDVFDWSHCNTIYWDSTTNIVYINARNLDNVWAIEYPSGELLWIAGRNGDFTMYDQHGNEKISLWWHSHSFYPILGEPNKFILFDNDLHNATSKSKIEGWTTGISRILEVEIDPDTRVMREIWSWAAPPDYYSPVWGYVERLPNGNRVGCFGSRSLPLKAKYGGALVEVNGAGEIVWQVVFPKGWGIYRGRRFQPSLSLNSPGDLTYDWKVNNCSGIIWTGISGFKDYYQITKNGRLLVNDTWTTAKIAYELPSDLAIGTHEYTLTVIDLAGQSVSDTVKVTVEGVAVDEIIPIVGVTGVIILLAEILTQRYRINQKRW